MLGVLASNLLRLLGLGAHRLSRLPAVLFSASQYKRVLDAEECFEIENAWDAFPSEHFGMARERLEELTASQVKDYERLLVKLVGETGCTRPSVLGIGCGTGIHAKIFELLGVEVEYYGCDVSQRQIEVARSVLPEPDRFIACDASELPYENERFDIAVLEGSLQHMREYTKGLDEAVRVAKRYVIIHRVTVVHEKPTLFYRRSVGNTTIPEIHLNEAQLISEARKNGLLVEAVETIKTRHIADGVFVFFKSYLCAKAVGSSKPAGMQ